MKKEKISNNQEPSNFHKDEKEFEEFLKFAEYAISKRKNPIYPISHKSQKSKLIECQYVQIIPAGFYLVYDDCDYREYANKIYTKSNIIEYCETSSIFKIFYIASVYRSDLDECEKKYHTITDIAKQFIDNPKLYINYMIERGTIDANKLIFAADKADGLLRFKLRNADNHDLVFKSKKLILVEKMGHFKADVQLRSSPQMIDLSQTIVGKELSK